MDENMFGCNTSAIKDWSYFLSHILPLVNRTSGLVNMDKAQTVTTAAVTSLQPDGGTSASNSPLNSNHTSGMEHIFQYSYSESDLLFTDNRSPARDPIPLPKAILYLVMAALVVVAVAYAIVGHLVKDVLNDFVGGGRSVVGEGDGGESIEAERMFSPRRVANLPAISCISVHETSVLGERLMEPSHARRLSPGQLDQTAVTVDETLGLPETVSGT